MPDIASVPCTANPTGRLYQPARSGGLAGRGLPTVGSVASYLKGKVVAALGLPARSAQVPLFETAAASGPA